MKLILDTDHLTIIQRQMEPAYSNLLLRIESVSPEEIFTTIINFEEQMRGWLSLLSNAKALTQEIAVYHRLSKFLSFFKDISILEYTAEAAEQFIKWRQMKLRVGSMDLKIAAIATSQKGLLLSRNLMDF